jgi:hypothetical protein
MDYFFKIVAAGPGHRRDRPHRRRQEVLIGLCFSALAEQHPSALLQLPVRNVMSCACS